MDRDVWAVSNRRKKKGHETGHAGKTAAGACSKGRNAAIRLPKDISFGREGNIHTVHLSDAAVTANMQKDPARLRDGSLR